MALKREVRMAHVKDEFESMKRKRSVEKVQCESNVEKDRCESNLDTGVKLGGDKKAGKRATKLEYRAFAKIDMLILMASKDTLKTLGKGKMVKRMTLEYSLKNDRKTIRVSAQRPQHVLAADVCIHFHTARILCPWDTHTSSSLRWHSRVRNVCRKRLQTTASSAAHKTG